MKTKPLFYAAAATLVAAAALAAGQRLTVGVEEAKIRSKKQFYAPAVAAVHFGDKVEAGAHDDGWYAVSFNGQRGYLHESALGSRAGKISGGWSGSEEAGADEVTLAGKGFNDDVERAYRQKHSGELDYTAVDAMEKRVASEGVLMKFMRSGQTLPEGR